MVHNHPHPNSMSHEVNINRLGIKSGGASSSPMPPKCIPAYASVSTSTIIYSVATTKLSPILYRAAIYSDILGIGIDNDISPYYPVPLADPSDTTDNIIYSMGALKLSPVPDQTRTYIVKIGIDIDGNISLSNLTITLADITPPLYAFASF